MRALEREEREGFDLGAPFPSISSSINLGKSLLLMNPCLSYLILEYSWFNLWVLHLSSHFLIFEEFGDFEFKSSILPPFDLGKSLYT